MPQERKIDFIDYLLVLLKSKKFLLIYFISVFILSYLAIYFLVEEKYDSTATILAPETDQLSGFSTLMKSVSGLSNGFPGLNKKSSTDIYTVLIYSRSNLDKLIKKFNLLQDYKEKSWDEARKILSSSITAAEDDNSAYQITVRSNNPQKSADMANFIVAELNKEIINLNISKSKNNRVFLEDRTKDIQNTLKISEDSLRKFQQKTGVFEINNQLKATIDAYASLESELASKEVEVSILEKLYGKESTTYQNAKTAEEEYKAKLNSIKNGKGESSFILSLPSIPAEGMQYMRLFRDVEINTKLLEFVIPLYEQAKFDEQKNVPIFQVIDNAYPPEKRSYPKRMILSLTISLAFLFIILLYIIVKELLSHSTNPKMQILRRELTFSKSNGN